MYKKNIVILTFLFLLFPKMLSIVHAEDNGKFRFVVMGCTHLGVCDFKDYGLAIDKIKECRPHFVLFLGGMVDAMGEKSVESLLGKFNLITSKLKVPVYNVFSNCHLAPLSMKNEVALMEKGGMTGYKKGYYSFEYKNNLFVCLDSDNLFKQSKNILADNSQMKFLNKILADVSKYENVFIAMGGSLWFQNSGNEWFKTIHPLIKKRVKPAYIFGANAHYFDSKKIDNVTYITSGSPSCYQGHSTKPSFFNFLIVDVDKNKVSINIEPINPIPIENLSACQQNDKNKYPPYIDIHKLFKIKSYILISPERQIILNPENIAGTLKIKPEMNILDVGAGTGLFTFTFAKALKGTGNVFATDVNSEMVDYIKNKAEESKYKNIIPVYVKPEGLDSFYKQHSFDIIFLSEVYDLMLHPEEYFRELRLSLDKNRGRLYIIHPKNVSDFSPIEFGDFTKVIKILNSEKEDFPVFGRLRQEIQYFIKNWQGGGIPSEIQTQITQNFNTMLYDRWLLNDLSEYYGSKNSPGKRMLLEDFLDPLDVRLARWLIVELNEKGVFNKKKKIINNVDQRKLCKLNRILIAGIFQSDKLYWITSRSTCVEKNSIISTMKSAGYQFIREYDSLLHHYFLEFKRKY